MSPMMIVFLAILTIYFIYEMKRSMHRSSVTNDLINRYAGDISHEEQEKLITEIYSYCQQDWKLKKIIHKYHADESTLHRLYLKLYSEGDLKKGRRYVPISSFFYVYTLEHILAHQDEEAKHMVMKCMNFFHF